MPRMYGKKDDIHRPALFARMVLIRFHLFIFGGWTESGLMGGPSLVSLSPYKEAEDASDLLADLQPVWKPGGSKI